MEKINKRFKSVEEIHEYTKEKLQEAARDNTDDRKIAIWKQHNRMMERYALGEDPTLGISEIKEEVKEEKKTVFCEDEAEIGDFEADMAKIKNMSSLEVDAMLASWKATMREKMKEDVGAMKVTYKPPNPYKLVNMNLDTIESFIHSFENYVSYVGKGKIKIFSYVKPSLWRRLAQKKPNVFKDSESVVVTTAILKYLKEIVNDEVKERRLNLLHNIITFKWKKRSGWSMKRAVQEHLEMAREFSHMVDNRETYLKVLRRCVETLPEVLNIYPLDVDIGKIKTFDALRDLIEKRKDRMEGLMANQKKRTYKSDENDTYDSDESSEESSSDSEDSLAASIKVVKKKSKKKLEINNVEEVNAKTNPEMYKACIVEEAEAEKAGICYACHSIDHHRANCNIVENRNNFQKRFIGRCFNCNRPGHRHSQCRIKLKDRLTDRLRQLNNKFNNSNSGRNNFNNSNYQKSNSNYNNSNYNNNTSNSNQTNQNNYQHQAQSNFQNHGSSNYQTGNNFQNVKRGYSNNYRNNYDNFNNYKKQSFNANEVEVIYKVNNVHIEEQNVEKDIVEVLKDGKWITVPGCADSGCATTTGCIKKHEHLCTKVWDYIDRPCVVQVADSQKYPVLKEGLMDVRINGKEVKDLKIKMVDVDNWTNLLIGRNCMIHNNIDFRS